jgi:hypothetical protein
MRRVEDWLLERLQRRCPHEDRYVMTTHTDYWSNRRIAETTPQGGQ